MPGPSVTQVLSVYADFSMVPAATLEHAAARGTAVHRACAAIAQGLWVPNLSDEAMPYVASFKQWWPLVQEVYAVEEELVDPVYGYVGHPDLIVRLTGEDFARVVDLKTPVAKSPLWAAQIAAYINLARQVIPPGMEIKRSGTLRLSPQGKVPKYDEYTESATDFHAFICVLTAYKFFTSGKEVQNG